jgi:hypothetical protein
VTNTLFVSAVELSVAEPPTYVCANVDNYVSDFCSGLSVSNPDNQFMCRADTIENLQCVDGICPCDQLPLGRRRRLFSADACQLDILVDHTAADVILPTPSWVQNATVVSTQNQTRVFTTPTPTTTPQVTTTAPEETAPEETAPEETTTTLTPQETPTSSASSSALPLGPIIGGVVGGVAFLAALLFFVFRLYRRKKRASANTPGASASLVFKAADPSKRN